MTLRARVLLGSGFIAVVLVAVALLVARSTEAYLVDQVDRQLAGAAGSARDLGWLDRRPGFPPPLADGRGPERPSSIYQARIDAEGTVTTDFTPTFGGGSVPVVDPDDARQAAEQDRFYTTSSEDGASRFRVRAEEVGDDVVVLALSLADVDDAVDRLVMVEVIATLVALAALALVAWWVIHLGVRPVKRMTESATAIAGGDLSRRVPEATPGTEAGELGVALNQMLGRIEEAFDERGRSEARLRQFVADASHELRTPVTTIRGYAELYRAGGLQGDGELDEALRRTEQEAVRMGNLVEDLLQLARLDEGRPLDLAPVDLAQVARDAARDAQAVEPDRVIDVVVEPVLVLADDERLHQVVANLVGNALVHTPPGTSLVLGVTRRDGDAVLEVVDRGPGMDQETAARAFERFYRADPSRSRHRGGSGLGLSIVQAVVGAHGGRVELTSQVGQGTTVRIVLPVAAGGEIPDADVTR
jgi:two-component system OmpR family sensor kinase